MGHTALSLNAAYMHPLGILRGIGKNGSNREFILYHTITFILNLTLANIQNK